MTAIKESDLFQPIKELFEAEGYTVYSEVTGPEGRADVVAVNGPILVVVELKASLSLDLMEQAHRWKPYAHRVYVAVPRPKRGNRFAEYILRQEGLGLIQVDFGYRFRRDRPLTYPITSVPARLNRNPTDSLRRSLREEQRFGPPGGSAGGGYVTDYKLTMNRVREFLVTESYDGDGWVTINEILKHVETHYLTPKQSLARALVNIEAAWCETKKEGGKLWFRMKPKEKEATTA